MRDSLPGEPIYQLPVTRSRPKGFANYTVRPGSKNARILDAARAALDRYRAQDRLPLGSRETGYVLTSDGFTKKDIDLVEDVLVRARRAEIIDFADISDGRTSSSRPWVPGDAEDAADTLLEQLDAAQVDRQAGQPFFVEVWAEAASWLTRLRRMCYDRGVEVFSGSGSVPVEAVRFASIRAVVRFKETGQLTVILQIGDLDVNGLRNIARPFEEDVRAFALDFGVPDAVIFRRLLLTAEQVEQYVPEAAWDEPTEADLDAGWPWPFKVQAEALLPEIRDQIVTDALDALHDDRDAIASALDAEQALRSTARAALRRRLRR